MSHEGRNKHGSALRSPMWVAAATMQESLRLGHVKEKAKAMKASDRLSPRNTLGATNGVDGMVGPSI